MKCGLLGRKLSHSYSPQIHSHLGSYSYQLFEKKADELEAFFADNSIKGFNVTIPHKKALIPFCQKLTDQAMKLGAVNTVVRQADGTWIGHNTDYFGFLAMTKRVRVNYAGKKVLVLGSGGASNTAVAAFDPITDELIWKGKNGTTTITATAIRPAIAAPIFREAGAVNKVPMVYTR